MIKGWIVIGLFAVCVLGMPAYGQNFVIDSFSVSPGTVSNGGSVAATVRVRNSGPSNGQLRSVRVVAAPVPAPLVAIPSTFTFTPPRLMAANEALNVPVAVAMPVLTNCVTTWSFGFDVTVDAGSGVFTRSFSGVGQNVTVTPACPDLTVPVPPGWSGPVIFSNTLNATSTSGLVSATLPIYVSGDVANLGGATPAGVPCVVQVVRSSDLAVVYSVNRILPALGAGVTNSSLRNTLVPAGVLVPCENYEARLLVDPDNLVAETNNGNNQFSSVSIFLNTPQSIQAQPSPQTVCQGSTVSFQVSMSSGGAAVFYRWKKNGIAIPISGAGGNPSAATSTLVLVGVQPADGAMYSCAVSNACDSLMSQGALLTVLPGTVVHQHPQDFRTCRGGVASFSTGVSGSGTISYQWRRAGATIHAATNPSAVTPTLVLSGVQPSDAGVYDCLVTGSCGVAATHPASLVLCVADTDNGGGTGTCDGGTTIDDLIYYLGVFEAGSAAADTDDGTGSGTPDGGVTIDDLIFYLARYEVGC